MDVEMVVLRLLHIVFGVFWMGTMLFLVLILEPRLRALGPEIQWPAMRAISKVMGPALGISGFITIAAGMAMYFRLSRGSLDRLFADGWAWAIFIGFVTSIAAYGFGVVSGVTSVRMGRIADAIEGRAPTPEEGGQMQKLSGWLVMAARIAAIFLLIAVGAMASARFV